MPFRTIAFMDTGRRTLALLAVEGCMASSVRTAREIVAYAAAGETAPRLSLLVASVDGNPVAAYGDDTVRPDCRLDRLAGPAADADGVAALLIPVVLGPLDPLFADDRFSREIRRLFDEGCFIAATCDAVFLLAASSVLDGRSAPVHPSLRDDFRRRFPAVRVNVDESRVSLDGILCSVGSASFADLMVETLRAVAGAAAADRCARVFLDRSGAATTGGRGWDRAALADPASRAAALIEERYSERLGIAEIAAEAGTTERTLARRFARRYGQSPASYLRSRRCAAAAALLSRSDLPVEEVAWRVGYADPSSFARAFRAYAKLSPAAYRAAYRGGD